MLEVTKVPGTAAATHSATMANIGTGQGPAVAVAVGAPGVFERPAAVAESAACAESTGRPGRENFAAPAGRDACAGFPAGLPAAFPGLAAAAAVAATFAACDSFGPADGLGRWDLGLRDAARLRAMRPPRLSADGRYLRGIVCKAPRQFQPARARDSRDSAATHARQRRPQRRPIGDHGGDSMATNQPPAGLYKPAKRFHNPRL